MNVKTIGEGIDLTAAAAGSSVDLNGTPFVEGREAVLVVSTDALSGATLKVQSSEDGSTWTDELTVSSQGPATFRRVTCKRYIRYNVTVAGTTGTANAYLLGSA